MRRILSEEKTEKPIPGEKNGTSVQIAERKKTSKQIAYRIPLKNKETGQRIKVAFFQPDQEDDKDPRLSMLEAAKKCWKTISHDKSAVAATKLLTARGCDWVQLLALVEQYCHYPSSELKQIEIDAAKLSLELNKKIGKFESKMAKWETEIGRINSLIEEELYVDVAAHAPKFDAYKAALHVARLAALPSAKNPHIEKESIVYLYHLINLSTGRAHYKELADILQARLHSRGWGGIDADDLQRILKRFRKDNPTRYTELQKAARLGLRWAPFSQFTLPPV